MISTFEIEGYLPGLNEIINANRTISKGLRPGIVGALLKRKWTSEVCQWIIVHKVPKYKSPIVLTIHWIEPHARRDLDNITAGTKFIMDGMVKMGIIENDGRKYVRGINHIFPPPDKYHPHIKVIISPIVK